MVIRKRLIVIGDGASGISLANKVRMLTDEREVEIVIIGNTPDHFLKEDGPQIVFGLKNYRKSVKKTKFLINYGISYISDEAVAIDTANKNVSVKSGKAYDFDYLVIALGGRPFPEGVPGYVGEAMNFQDLAGTIDLRETINKFNGGNVVIANSPGTRIDKFLMYEFAFLFRELAAERGFVANTKFSFVSEGGDSVTLAFDKELESLGFEIYRDFEVNGISSKNKELQAVDGKAIKYDLLILSPPFKPEKVLTASKISSKDGFVAVDPDRLNVLGQESIFAIGECTDLKVSKCLGASLNQAAYLAKIIAHRISGSYYEARYDGSLVSSVLVGKQRSVTVFSNYSRPVLASYGSFTDYIVNMTSTETYFSAAIRGVL
ncbi:MAG: FAD-dependent oxidoreductase [Thermoplasmataceae archaeon]